VFVKFLLIVKQHDFLAAKIQHNTLHLVFDV